MANGFDELAAMTATEEINPMRGMEPILVDLAASLDKRVANSAIRHLHHVYGHWPSDSSEARDDAQA